jgi:hypothetical protein
MKSIPVIGSVFELVGNAGVKLGNELQLTTAIGQQVQIEGQEVTFTESLYDGSKINIGLQVTNPDVDLSAISRNIMYRVDDKFLEYTGSTNFEELEDGTFAGIISIAPEQVLPDTFMLEIISRHDRATIYAELPVERQGGGQSFPIGKTLALNDGEFTYEDVALFPTSTVITYHTRNAGIPPKWSFQVEDERGLVLETVSESSRGYKDEHTVEVHLAPFEKRPERIIIKPYTSNSISKSVVSGAWDGSPITISQGDAGALTILDQHEQGNQLTFTYEVSGTRIYDQVHLIWLQDSEGNEYHKDSLPNRIGDSNQYEITFSNVQNLKDFFIVTPQFQVQYFDDYAVTVDLK